MTPENFCYWLQGYFEISQHIDHRLGLSEEAIEEIRNHLSLVLEKKTTTVPTLPRLPYPPMNSPVITY